jgi:hypothetical protein
MVCSGNIRAGSVAPRDYRYSYRKCFSHSFSSRDSTTRQTALFRGLFRHFLTSLLVHPMYSNAHLRCRVLQNSFDRQLAHHHSHPCKIGSRWKDYLSPRRNIHDSITSGYLIVQGVRFPYQWPSISRLRLQEKAHSCLQDIECDYTDHLFGSTNIINTQSFSLIDPSAPLYKFL